MKLNPFTCLQLYDLCLKRGFNSMDSYLMLKEDSEILIHAYEIMESSRKYSEQQLEYITENGLTKWQENVTAIKKKYPKE